MKEAAASSMLQPLLVSRPEMVRVGWALEGKAKVVRGGVEPPTHGFSVRCSTS